MSERVVKVALPLDLIKRMDQALADGRGGLGTRAEFIREASESFLTEISYPDAPPEPNARVRGPVPDNHSGERRTMTSVGGAANGSDKLPRGILDAIPPWELEELRLSDLAGTALPPVRPGATLESGIAQPGEGPLLGLHNRDYPSLWAAHRLARYTEDALVSFDDFRQRVTNAAWFYAAELGSLESENGGTRLRALFPSNLEKRESAERAFQTFAIGVISRRPSKQGPIKADGPLFVWRLCQLARQDGELVIGLTNSGRLLLQQLEGLSLELPHSPDAAERFLAHLGEVAPGERWGFDQIITAAAGQPNREELVSFISRGRTDWTPATANSIAQGYVARAREWGLVEPRLHEGRYRLTEFGHTCLQDAAAQPTRTRNSKRKD
jgi:hypothetical protein